MTYSDDDIDAAIERIAADVARRSSVPEFHGPAMEALLAELRRMETARRAGDAAAAKLFAATASSVLEGYRPTNSTSRSKAILLELIVEVLATDTPPA